MQTKSDVTKDLDLAMIEAMLEIRPICKTLTGDAGRGEYDYADFGSDVLPAINMVGLKHGILTTHPAWVSETGDTLVSCEITHAATGQWRRAVVRAASGDKGSPSQGQGSSITYAKRYATLAAWGVHPVAEDNDAGGGSAQMASSQKKNGYAAKPAARATSPDPTQQAPAGSIGAALTDPQAVAAKVASCLSLVARSREHAVAAGFADERKNAISSIMASKYIFTAPQGGPPTGIARTDNQPMTLADCMALEVQFGQVAKKYAEMAGRVTDGAP